MRKSEYGRLFVTFLKPYNLLETSFFVQIYNINGQHLVENDRTCIINKGTRQSISETIIRVVRECKSAKIRSREE